MGEAVDIRAFERGEIAPDAVNYEAMKDANDLEPGEALLENLGLVSLTAFLFVADGEHWLKHLQKQRQKNLKGQENIAERIIGASRSTVAKFGTYQDSGDYNLLAAIAFLENYQNYDPDKAALSTYMMCKMASRIQVPLCRLV